MRRATGRQDGSPSATAPPGHKAAGAPTDKIQHKDVPSVQENVNNCITGSYARSIKWLDNKYDLKNLPNTKTAQQIYDDLNNLGVGIGSPNRNGKTEGQMLTIKANYLKGLDDRAITKFLDVSDFLAAGIDNVTEVKNVDTLEWIYRELPTEDMEMLYDSHCITVTGIYKQGGKIFVRYRDDEDQSNPPNTKGDDKEKEGELRKVGGKWQFQGAQLDYLVSESVPEPTPPCFALPLLPLLLTLGLFTVLQRRGKSGG